MSDVRSSQYSKVLLSVRKVISVAALITLTGCASFIKAGSLNEVHERFNEQNYKETLILIRRAENLNELEPDLIAELTYIKARSLEALGHSREASALYDYLKSQHATSQYAWLAALRLDTAEGVDNQSSNY